MIGQFTYRLFTAHSISIFNVTAHRRRPFTEKIKYSVASINWFIRCELAERSDVYEIKAYEINVEKLAQS